MEEKDYTSDDNFETVLYSLSPIFHKNKDLDFRWREEFIK